MSGAARSSSISSSDRRRRPALWPAATAGGALLAFALFLGASEAIVRLLVEPQDHFERHVAVFRAATAADAVFGDSVAANGLILDDPGFVNLASPGEGPKQMLVKARAYFAGRAPGRVIVGANVNLLGRQPEDTAGYEVVFGPDGRPPLRILEPQTRRLVAEYWRVLLTRGQFESIFEVLPHGGLVLSDPAGYDRFARLPEAERREEARRELADNVPDPAFAAGNLRHLDELVRFLANAGAEVCLVRLPKSPAYRRLAPEYPAVAAAHEAIGRMARATGVRHVDLWTALDDPRHYRNSDHLTAAGGRLAGRLALDACFG